MLLQATGASRSVIIYKIRPDARGNFRDSFEAPDRGAAGRFIECHRHILPPEYCAPTGLIAIGSESAGRKTYLPPLVALCPSDVDLAIQLSARNTQLRRGSRHRLAKAKPSRLLQARHVTFQIDCKGSGGLRHSSDDQGVFASRVMLVKPLYEFVERCEEALLMELCQLTDQEGRPGSEDSGGGSERGEKTMR